MPVYARICLCLIPHYDHTSRNKARYPGMWHKNPGKYAMDDNAADTHASESNLTKIYGRFVVKRMHQQDVNRRAIYSDRCAFLERKHHLKLPDAIEKEREDIRRHIQHRTEQEEAKRNKNRRKGMRIPTGGDFKTNVLVSSCAAPRQPPPLQQGESSPVYVFYPTRHQSLACSSVGPSQLESSSHSQHSQTEDQQYNQYLSYPGPPQELLSSPSAGTYSGLPLPKDESSSIHVCPSQSIYNEDDNEAMHQLLEGALQDTLPGEPHFNVVADQVAREQGEIVPAAVNFPYGTAGREMAAQQPPLFYLQQEDSTHGGGNMQTSSAPAQNEEVFEFSQLLGDLPSGLDSLGEVDCCADSSDAMF